MVVGTSASPVRPVHTVRTLSWVCLREAVYSALATAAITLARAAPRMVPATLSREPSAAAVIAARAPATILVSERSSLLSLVSGSFASFEGAVSAVTFRYCWFVLMSSSRLLGRA